MKFLKIYIVCIMLLGLGACNNSSSDSANEKTQLSPQNVPVVTKAEAIKIATKIVEQSKADGHWLSAKNYKVVDSRDINDSIKAYEIAVFDKNNEPLGYLNVPTYEGNGVVSTFNYEGLAKSKVLEDKYNQVWKDRLSKNNITVNEKKLVGSYSGIFALAVKVNDNKESIQEAQSIADYYVFTLYPVPNLQQALGLKKEPHSSVNEKLLKEERETRQALLE